MSNVLHFPLTDVKGQMGAYLGIQKSLSGSLKCLKQIDDSFPKLGDFSQTHFSFGLLSPVLVIVLTCKMRIGKERVVEIG